MASRQTSSPLPKGDCAPCNSALRPAVLLPDSQRRSVTNKAACTYVATYLPTYVWGSKIQILPPAV